VQVVLRSDVDHLGLRGDVVNVARGYARNYLLPRGLAELATPGLLRELERRDTQRARHEATSTEEAQAIAARLEATELRFDVNAGPTGALFGSVTATNVADRLWDEQKIRLDRRKIGMQTIKRVGRYAIPIEVFAEVSAELRLVVVPEGGELPPEGAEPEPEAAEAAAEVESEDAGPEPVAETIAETVADEAEPPLDEASADGSPADGSPVDGSPMDGVPADGDPSARETP
jgi:large subunit ribosomal protein L9